VITEYTVKNQLRNILSKLHRRSRTEAARFARERGMLELAAPVYRSAKTMHTGARAVATCPIGVNPPLAGSTRKATTVPEP
jgi:hypothetical protein